MQKLTVNEKLYKGIKNYLNVISLDILNKKHQIAYTKVSNLATEFKESCSKIKDSNLGKKMVILAYGLGYLSNALTKKDDQLIEEAQWNIEERIPFIKDGLEHLIKKQSRVNITLH